MATQNLGNVRALIVSATAPTNTNLLWRNTSVTPHTTNLYDTQMGVWVAISMTGGTSDPDAVHVNVAGEIVGVTEKANGVAADLIIIEDSADSNNKKRLQLGNIPYPITRNRVSPGTASANFAIDFGGQNEYFTTTPLIVQSNVNITFSNATNAEFAILLINVTGTRNLVFPNTVIFQDTETRWTIGTRTLALNAGFYKMTMMNAGGSYSCECSANYSTS